MFTQLSHNINFYFRITFISFGSSFTSGSLTTPWTRNTLWTYRPLLPNITSVSLVTFSPRAPAPPCAPAGPNYQSSQEDLRVLQHHAFQLDLNFQWVHYHQNLLSNPSLLRVLYLHAKQPYHLHQHHHPLQNISVYYLFYLFQSVEW